MCLVWMELDWGQIPSRNQRDFHFLSWNRRMGWKGPYSSCSSSFCYGLIAAHQIRLPRNPSSPTLGTSKNGAPTASLGNLHHCLSTLSIPITLLSCHGLKIRMPWFYYVFFSHVFAEAWCIPFFNFKSLLTFCILKTLLSLLLTSFLDMQLKCGDEVRLSCISMYAFDQISLAVVSVVT